MNFTPKNKEVYNECVDKELDERFVEVPLKDFFENLPDTDLTPQQLAELPGFDGVQRGKETRTYDALVRPFFLSGPADVHV